MSARPTQPAVLSSWFINSFDALSRGFQKKTTRSPPTRLPQQTGRRRWS